VSRRRTHGAPTREFPRTARLNHLVHEIVADEAERLDDDRLGFLTIISVEVEPDLRHAVVWYSSLDDADDDVLQQALAQHRPRLQAAVARQARLKRTPELAFRVDEVTRSAQRVEGIIREWHRDER
jgi:ribosome-binding factor A